MKTTEDTEDAEDLSGIGENALRQHGQKTKAKIPRLRDPFPAHFVRSRSGSARDDKIVAAARLKWRLDTLLSGIIAGKPRAACRFPGFFGSGCGRGRPRAQRYRA